MTAAAARRLIAKLPHVRSRHSLPPASPPYHPLTTGFDWEHSEEDAIGLANCILDLTQRNDSPKTFHLVKTRTGSLEVWTQPTTLLFQ